MNAYERNSNIDALITLSAHVLEDEDLETMREADVSDVEIPHRLYRKIMRRIRKHDRQTEMSKAYIFARRIAAVFLIVCSISFALCLSVEAIRTEIWNTIIDWYEEYVEIHFENNGAVANVIEEYKEPHMFLENVETIVVGKTEDRYLIYYYLDGVRVMFYQQISLNDGLVLQKDNEDCNIKEILMNNQSAYLFEYYDGKISIVWNDNEYSYVITAYDRFMTADMLVEVAESVK